MFLSSCRSICHSLEPQASSVHVSSPRPKGLGHRCTSLTAYAYPPMALLHRVIQKNQALPLPDHCNSPRLARDTLILGPSAALNRDPTATSSVNNTSKTVPQSCGSHVSSTSQPPHLASRSGQLLRTRLLCGGGRENYCPSEVINKDHLQVKVGPI